MPKYVYYTNCINSTYEAITAMTERARDITYTTLLQHVGIDTLLDTFPGYARYPQQGLTLKNDWHVSYHKSRYEGKRCYYVRHSAIEYIFIKEE